MEPSKRAPPTTPGSIDDIGARLRLWCTRSEAGLARVEFVSEAARRQVVAGLRQDLSSAGIELAEITLPAASEASRLVPELLQRLRELPPGVVSIDGFASALPTDPERLAAALYRFNLARERLGEILQRQIWWMPPHFAAAFARVVPDLDSWFLVKLRLTESIQTAESGQRDQSRPGSSVPGTPIDMDEFKRLADVYGEQIRRELERVEQRTRGAGRSLRDSSERFTPATWSTASETRLDPAELRRLAADYSERFARGQQQGLSGAPLEDLLGQALTLLRQGGLEDEARALEQRWGNEQQEVAPPKRSGQLPLASLGKLFIGREAEIERLTEEFGAVPASPAALVTRVICGSPGVGKTRLAIEYGWRRIDAYALQLMVSAEDPAALERNLAALCARLELPEQEVKAQATQKTAVLRWLRAHPGWLLIIDGADTPDAVAAVQELLAQLAGGHVLVTSRLTRWSAGLPQQRLEVLASAAAVEFLLARTAGKRREQPDDEERARALATELGGLPLALEQAGATIAQRGQSFAEYLDEWQRAARPQPGSPDSRWLLLPILAIGWQFALARLSGSARKLLHRLAWFAPEAIPEALLEIPLPGIEHSDRSGRAANEARAAFLELADGSLVERTADASSFRVNPLLQEYSRTEQRAEAPVPEALGEALTWLDAAFVGKRDAHELHDRQQLEALAPHARAIAEYADQAGIGEPTARLFNALGLLLMAKALYGEAEPLLRRALRIEQASFDRGHPALADYLDDLAQLLQITGRLGEAEAALERALKIDEENFGADHPRVALRLTSLADLLAAAGRRREAESLLHHALAIDEASFGKVHPSVARDLYQLAWLQQQDDHLPQAEPLLRRALQSLIASLGPAHLQTQQVQDEYRRLLQAMGRSEDEIRVDLAALLAAP